MVRHLPVIGASRTIITTGRVAIVIASRVIAGVVERAQICTIRIDGNGWQRRMRMRLLLLVSANQMLLEVWIVVVRHHEVIRFVCAESTVLVGVL